MSRKYEAQVKYILYKSVRYLLIGGLTHNGKILGTLLRRIAKTEGYAFRALVNAVNATGD